MHPSGRRAHGIESAGAAERGVVLRLKGEREDGFVARAGLLLGGDLSSHPPPPARAAARRAPLPAGAQPAPRRHSAALRLRLKN